MVPMNATLSFLFPPRSTVVLLPAGLKQYSGPPFSLAPPWFDVFDLLFFKVLPLPSAQVFVMLKPTAPLLFATLLSSALLQPLMVSPSPLLNSTRLLSRTVLPVPSTTMPLPPFFWTVLPRRTFFSAVAERRMPAPVLLSTVPPRRSFVSPFTQMPAALPLTVFQLTRLVLPSTWIPQTDAPEAPTPRSSLLLDLTSHPTVPPIASGPMIVNTPAPSIVTTGLLESAAVILALRHSVMVRVLSRSSTAFSIVGVNRQMVCPFAAC